LVVVSAGLLDEISRFFPQLRDRITVVPNGVDIETYGRAPDDRAAARATMGFVPGDVVALFVGGDWERKGLRFVLQAVSLTKAVRLLVVGRGDATWYGNIAASAGIADRIKFAGVADRLMPYFSAADLFILPTAYETFSVATHEAAAAGLPLLVSRVNGVKELLVDGVNGWFITQDPVQIADRLDRLVEPNVRRQMGDRSREAVQRFSWSAMVDGYWALYSLVGQESHRSSE
jgi:UDP-glucose:(heptosyl)LPS alpha-1,3-glucosyltransferase